MQQLPAPSAATMVVNGGGDSGNHSAAVAAAFLSPSLEKIASKSKSVENILQKVRASSSATRMQQTSAEKQQPAVDMSQSVHFGLGERTPAANGPFEDPRMTQSYYEQRDEGLNVSPRNLADELSAAGEQQQDPLPAEGFFDQNGNKNVANSFDHHISASDSREDSSEVINARTVVSSNNNALSMKLSGAHLGYVGGEDSNYAEVPLSNGDHGHGEINGHAEDDSELKK